MRKLCVILSILLLSSCGSVKNTIQRIPLTGDEQQIASLAGDIVEKFRFKKNQVYDICIYLCRDGVLETVGQMLGIDTKDKDKTVLIGGRKDESASMAWSVATDGAVYKSPVVETEDVTDFASVSGVGQEKFSLEEGEEAVLVYVAYQDVGPILSTVDLFYTWDTGEDKAEALAGFRYAYVVTVRLSQLPGYTP